MSFCTSLSEVFDKNLLLSNVYNMRGVHGIFCVFVGMGLSYSLTDLIPSGKFLTDLKRIMLLVRNNCLVFNGFVFIVP